MTQEPEVLRRLQARAAEHGFTMSSTAQIGPLLAALAASKPGGRILELGTGVGAGAAWILQGMTWDAILITVELDPGLSAIARAELGVDTRVTFRVGDGQTVLTELADSEASFDVIFADTWPGKFHARELALSRLAPGGIYVLDDLDDSGAWPDGHATAVAELVQDLRQQRDLTVVQIPWASGVLLAVRTGRGPARGGRQ